MSVHLGVPTHVGYVVKDIEQTSEYLSSIFGLGTWQVLDVWPDKEELIKGEPYGLRCAYANLGGVEVELLQPLKGDTIWSQALKEGKEGIHHICYSVSNWDEVVEKLIALGGKVTQGASYKGKRWCYVDLQQGGFLLEIAEEGLGE